MGTTSRATQPADIAAFEAYLKGSGKLQLLEPESPTESSSSEDSTPAAHQGDDHDVEGQTAADKAAPGALIERPTELQLLENSPSGGPSSQAVDSTSTAQQSSDRDIEGHATAGNPAFEAYTEKSEEPQLLEKTLSKSPSSFGDSTSTAHDVEGHAAADNAVHEAHIEDDAKVKSSPTAPPKAPHPARILHAQHTGATTWCTNPRNRNSITRSGLSCTASARSTSPL